MSDTRRCGGGVPLRSGLVSPCLRPGEVQALAGRQMSVWGGTIDRSFSCPSAPPTTHSQNAAASVLRKTYYGRPSDRCLSTATMELSASPVFLRLTALFTALPSKRHLSEVFSSLTQKLLCVRQLLPFFSRTSNFCWFYDRETENAICLKPSVLFHQ